MTKSKAESWSEEDIKLLREVYPHLIWHELVLLFPTRNRTSLANKAKRLGLHKDGTKFLRAKLNEEFFKEPNILNCYWAGFIAGDGCILSSRPTLEIMLAEVDKYHLERFKEDINYSGNVTTRKHGKGSVADITVMSEILIEDLRVNFNITPRKTYTVIPPNISDLNLIMSFICGYIDADGSIYLSGGIYPVVSICGTQELIEWMKSYLDRCFPSDRGSNSNLIHSKISPHLYTLNLSNNRAIKLDAYLKDFALPRMARKWGIIQRGIEIKQERSEKFLEAQYSRTKGITFDKRGRKWVASKYINRKKTLYLGYFKTEEEAIRCLEEYYERENSGI